MQVASFGLKVLRKLTPSQWLRWRARRLLCPSTLLNIPAFGAVGIGSLQVSFLTLQGLVLGLLFIAAGIWAFLDSFWFYDSEQWKDEFGVLSIETGRTKFTAVNLDLRRRFFDRVEDRGIVWFEDNALCYHGHRTSFRLPSPASTDIVRAEHHRDLLADSVRDMKVWVEDRWIEVIISDAGFDFPKSLRDDFDVWAQCDAPTSRAVLPPKAFQAEPDEDREREIPRHFLWPELTIFALLGLAALARGKWDGLLLLAIPLVARPAMHFGMYIAPRLVNRKGEFDNLREELTVHRDKFHQHLIENPGILERMEFGDPPTSA